MGRATKAAISMEMLERWRQSLAALMVAHRNSPDSELAGMWRLRIDIIQYLLRRYAGEEFRLEGENTPAQLSEEQKKELLGPPPVTVASRPTCPPGMGTSIRSSSVLQKHLETLAECNKFRTEELERAHQQLLEQLEEERKQREIRAALIRKQKETERRNREIIDNRIRMEEEVERRNREMIANRNRQQEEDRRNYAKMTKYPDDIHRMVKGANGDVELKASEMATLLDQINPEELIAIADREMSEEQILDLLLGKE